MTDAATFYRKSEEWLNRFLELNPVAATETGVHSWDARLADCSAASLDLQNRKMQAALTEFKGMDRGAFDHSARIDHTIMVQVIKSLIRQYEKVAGHRRDPGYYMGEVMGGAFVLVMKEFAPLPERLKSVAGRLGEAAGVLSDGRKNIVPAEVPRVWAEVALEQARQAPGLMTEFLPGLATQAAPALEPELRRAGEQAAAAAQEFAQFIEKDVLPKATGDFAVGRQLFDEILRENHMVDYDADELLGTGWRLFRDTEEAMQAVAMEIDPTKSVEGILEAAKSDHPRAADVLKAYQDAMEAAKRFVLDHGIATIPAGETLRVVETPAYLRVVLPYAAYMPPGILEEKQDGMFLVTPVEPGWSDEMQEQKLKGHNYAKLPITALHEAYPGHHLQLVWSNRQKMIPRRMGAFLSTLFIEGWAFYCEELMEDLGFISKPIQRLWRLADQLWRAARIILDVSLHTKGMPVPEAVAFLVEKCKLEPSNALAEVRRYTGAPTQPQSYLMGKLAILELVEEYRRANPALSLRQMHDAILSCGSLPPKLMRLALLGD